MYFLCFSPAALATTPAGLHEALNTQNNTHSRFLYKNGNLFLPFANVTFMEGSAILVVDYNASNIITTAHDIAAAINHSQIVIAKYIEANQRPNQYLFPMIRLLQNRLELLERRNDALLYEIEQTLLSFSSFQTSHGHDKRSAVGGLIIGISTYLILNHFFSQDKPTLPGSPTLQNTIMQYKRMYIDQEHDELVLQILAPVQSTHLTLSQFMYQELSLENSYNTLLGTFNKLQHMLNSILIGRLTHDLIGVHEYYDLLVALKVDIINHGLDFYYPLRVDSLAMFYKNAQTRAEYMGNNILRVAIILPLIRPSRQFSLHQIIQLPNFLYQTNTSVSHQVQGNYIAINSEQYIILQETQLVNCLYDNPKLCPLTSPIQYFSVPSCEKALFFNDDTEIEEQCVTKVQLNTPPYFAKIPNRENEWAYSVPWSMQFKAECLPAPDSDQHITLTGSGLFSLPHNCSLINSYFNLRVHQKFELTDITSNLKILINPVVLNMSLAEQVEQNISEIFKNKEKKILELKKEVGLPKEINLQDYLTLLKEGDNNQQSHKSWYHHIIDSVLSAVEYILYLLAVLAATFLSLQLLWWLFIWYIKKESSRPQPI